MNKHETVNDGKIFNPIELNRANLNFNSNQLIDSTKKKQQIGELTMPKLENPLIEINSRLINYTLNFIKDQSYPGAQTYIDYTIVRLGLKPLADVTPLLPEYGIVVNDVTAFKYPIEIAKCRKETNANRTLFIGIISAPNYFDKRQLLRETWLRHVNDPHYHRGLIDVVGFGFILGQTSNATIQSQIEEESRKHGDILQVEMDDSYRNLTRKSVAFLNWVNSNCPHVDFALKIDDDCYSNVHNLANILADSTPREISVYGNLLEENLSASPSGNWPFWI